MCVCTLHSPTRSHLCDSSCWRKRSQQHRERDGERERERSKYVYTYIHSPKRPQPLAQEKPIEGFPLVQNVDPALIQDYLTECTRMQGIIKYIGHQVGVISHMLIDVTHSITVDVLCRTLCYCCYFSTECTRMRGVIKYIGHKVGVISHMLYDVTHSMTPTLCPTHTHTHAHTHTHTHTGTHTRTHTRTHTH